MDLVKIGSYIAEKRKKLGMTQKQPVSYTHLLLAYCCFCKCVEGNRLECHYLSGSNHSN